MALCPRCGQRVRLVHEGEQAIEPKPVPSEGDGRPRSMDELKQLRELEDADKKTKKRR